MKSKNFDIDVLNDPFFAEYQLAIEKLHTRARTEGLNDIERLAEAGSIMSVFFIADAIRIGHWYTLDLPRAEMWYQLADNWGSARGRFGLGCTHLEMKEYDRAIEDLEAAIAKGFPPAYNALALIYFYGQGVAVDRVRALELWRKGASLGHLASERNLIHRSLHGQFGFWQRILAIVRYVPFAIEYAIVQVKTPYTDRLR